jgi:hypothetical protein
VPLQTYQTTDEAVDNEIVAVGPRFGVVGVADPGDVSRELHDGILEAGAGA